MTIHEKIEQIKLKGNCLRHEVIGMPNDKYSEPVILEYENNYFLIYSIYENFSDACPFEDMEEFNLLHRAERRYEELIIELQRNIQDENN